MSDVNEEFEQKTSPLVQNLYEVCKEFKVELGVMFLFPDNSERSTRITEPEYDGRDNDRMQKVMHAFSGLLKIINPYCPSCSEPMPIYGLKKCEKCGKLVELTDFQNKVKE